MRSIDDRAPAGWWLGLIRGIDSDNDVSLIIQVVTPWKSLQRYDFDRRQIVARRVLWVRLSIWSFARGGSPHF